MLPAGFDCLRSTSGLSFTNQLPYQPQHFAGFCMSVCGQLGVQQLPIRGHFEPAAIRWHKHNVLDQVLIVPEQLFRQAHGPAGVMSDRAVDDLDLQHATLRKF